MLKCSTCGKRHITRHKRKAVVVTAKVRRHLKVHSHHYALIGSAFLAELFAESFGKSLAVVLKVVGLAH
jgi:hypothetical protein